MSDALQRFKGGTIVSIELLDDEILGMTVSFPDGSSRTLAVCHPWHEDITVCIDGKPVPNEEL